MNSFTSFASVMVSLNSVVALLNTHELPSARLMGEMVTLFGASHAFGRRSAALGIRGMVAIANAREVKPSAGELALLNCAIELVAVGETFAVESRRVALAA